MRDVLLLLILPGDVSRLVPDILAATTAGYNLKEMGFYAELPLLAGTVGDLSGRLGVRSAG